MLGYLVVGCCAYIFYRIGETEYGRGGLLALLSVIFAVASLYVLRIPVPFFSLLLSQLLLFLLLWVYNCFRKKPVD